MQSDFLFICRRGFEFQCLVSICKVIRVKFRTHLIPAYQSTSAPLTLCRESLLETSGLHPWKWQFSESSYFPLFSRLTSFSLFSTSWFRRNRSTSQYLVRNALLSSTSKQSGDSNPLSLHWRCWQIRPAENSIFPAIFHCTAHRSIPLSNYED